MRRVGDPKGNIHGREVPDILSFCFEVCLFAKNHPMTRHLTQPLFRFLACVLAGAYDDKVGGGKRAIVALPSAP
jgi:hypothetical protein